MYSVICLVRNQPLPQAKRLTPEKQTSSWLKLYRLVHSMFRFMPMFECDIWCVLYDYKVLSENQMSFSLVTVLTSVRLLHTKVN